MSSLCYMLFPPPSKFHSITTFLSSAILPFLPPFLSSSFHLTSYPHASLNILQSIACLLAMSNPTPNPSQLSSFELHSLSNNSPFLTRFLSFSFETHTTFLRSTSLLPFQFSIQSLSSLSRNSTSPASIPHLPSPLLTSACLRSRHLCLFSL